MDRDEALELLESQHDFPGPFEFRVVIPPSKKELTVSAMAAALDQRASIERVSERLSRQGNYLALRVRIQLESAEGVLEVYSVINALEYVHLSM